ncbi:unnamed protein product [Musa acuminata var. zebrina]
MFRICEETSGPMIDQYTLSFSYTCSKNYEVCMKISRTGNKKNVVCFRSSAGKMILMRPLDQTPEEGKRDGGHSFVLLQNKKLKWLVSMFRRTILMKPLYHDDVTVRLHSD